MKRHLVNALVTVSFIAVFSVIIHTFSGHFVFALTGKGAVFPPDRPLFSDQVESWAEQVRQFSLEAGEKADHVTVLLYHRIVDDRDFERWFNESEEPLSGTVVKKSAFEEQMRYLREENYVSLTAKEFQLFMEGKLDVPQKSVLITFDDGFKDNYAEAYPILKENGLTALNFLITSQVTKWDQRYRANAAQYFSLSELEASRSVYEFYSHTYNFHQRTEDGKAFLEAKSKEEIKADLAASLVNLNGRTRAFAYPYGAYTEETIEILKELGIEMAFTVEYKDARPGMSLYEIPRKTVYLEDTLEDFILKLDHNGK